MLFHEQEVRLWQARQNSLFFHTMTNEGETLTKKQCRQAR